MLCSSLISHNKPNTAVVSINLDNAQKGVSIELDNNSIQKLSKAHPRSFFTLKVDPHIFFIHKAEY